LEIKEEALLCLKRLAQCCSNERLDYFVEHIQLLEIMIFALEINLESDTTFKIIETLVYVLGKSNRYCKLAINYGLLSQVIRLMDSPIVQISEAAAVLDKMYHDL
jgi:hypothetical protein